MKEAWQKAPLTSLIILIQVIVFILMTLAGGSTNSQVLIEFGALYAADQGRRMVALDYARIRAHWTHASGSQQRNALFYRHVY